MRLNVLTQTAPRYRKKYDSSNFRIRTPHPWTKLLQVEPTLLGTTFSLESNEHSRISLCQYTYFLGTLGWNRTTDLSTQLGVASTTEVTSVMNIRIAGLEPT